MNVAPLVCKHFVRLPGREVRSLMSERITWPRSVIINYWKFYGKP